MPDQLYYLCISSPQLSWIFRERNRKEGLLFVTNCSSQSHKSIWQIRLCITIERLLIDLYRKCICITPGFHRRLRRKRRERRNHSLVSSSLSKNRIASEIRNLFIPPLNGSPLLTCKFEFSIFVIYTHNCFIVLLYEFDHANLISQCLKM